MSEGRKAELKNIAVVIKALIASAKPPRFLSQILKEYKATEYEVLPYRRLGYTSPIELLMDTGEFSFFNCSNGDAIITANTSKSSHITKMIENQKCRDSAKSYGKFKISKNLKPRHHNSLRTSSMLNYKKELFNKVNGDNVYRAILADKNIAMNRKSEEFFKWQEYQNISKQNVSEEYESFAKSTSNMKEGVNALNKSNWQENLEPQNPGMQLHNLAKRLEFVRLQPKKDPLDNDNNVNRMLCPNLIDIKSKSLPKHNDENVFKLSGMQNTTTSLNCPLSEIEFVNKVYEELSRHPHGVFAKDMPKILENQYLPENWLALLNASNKFSIETTTKHTCIIYANSDYESEKENNGGYSHNDAVLQKPKQQCPNIGLSLSQRNEGHGDAVLQQQCPNIGLSLSQRNEGHGDAVLQQQYLNIALPWSEGNDGHSNAIFQEHEQQCPNIELPWTQDLWNIYITNCTSTTEIWGFVIDKNYLIHFELFEEEIKSYMDKQSVRARSVNNSNFYLTCKDKRWCRVQIKKLDFIGAKALCFYIDFGYIEWIRQYDLYECKENFLMLPARIVKFSLFGLDDCANNPYAPKCLEKLLHEKEMVAKILTKKIDFFNNTKSNFEIQIILFESSMQDTLTINDRLLNAICDEASAPEIRENLLTNVLVTKTCDDGDIYIQVQNNDLQYIQEIIENTVRSKLKMDQHNATHKDLTSNQLFLILDEECNNNVKWYRAELVKNNEVNYLQADNFELYYIDFGIKRWRNISKIFLLENLSVILKRFPPQVIKVHLYNISNIMIKNSKKIHNLLPINCKAMVKRVKSTLDPDTNSVPLVTVYVQLNDPDFLCNVNDAILFEHGLEKCVNNIQPEMKHAQNVDFSLTCEQEHEKEYNILRKLEDYNSIPNVGSNFDVRVIAADNPSNFVVQPYQHYASFRNLMNELEEYYTLNAKMLTVRDIKIGEAYAAQNAMGNYSRVIALKKHDNIVHVNYCDYGVTRPLTKDQLKPLPNEFRHLPKMAIKAKLFGIKPIAQNWTTIDCVHFYKLTLHKTFLSIVKGVRDDTSEGAFTKIVELELIDASKDVDVYIHKILLTRKRAVRTF